MSEYIGLTIGPIYPTLKQARRTRELWGASFLFSSIFKLMVLRLKKWVILPHVEDAIYPVGLYPDRIILEVYKSGEKLTIERIHKEIKEIFTEIAADYCNIFKHTEESKKEKVLDALQNAIQIHGYEAKIPKGENIILKLFTQLDNMELFNQMPPINQVLLEYLEKVNETILYKKSGWPQSKTLESLFEISAVSLSGHDNFMPFIKKHFSDVDRYERTKSKEIKERLEQFTNSCKTTFGKEFKPFHKYFALVHADGDNMGKIVTSIGHDADKVMDFSAALYQFGIASAKIIKAYGGFPVYIGGDDLLFFAPLANPRGKDAKNILELVQKLDTEFETKHKESITKLLGKEIVDPSFSFGISVNFFKYPLKESFENSYLNLQRAKSAQFKKKNSLFITLQKHSGQQIETGFEKSDLFYLSKIFPFIIDFCVVNEDEKEEYNSFRRKSAEYHPFLKYAVAYGGTVSNFLEKNFSEHDFKKAGYWKRLGEVISEAYLAPSEADKKAELVYFAIRFIDFLNSETNE